MAFPKKGPHGTLNGPFIHSDEKKKEEVYVEGSTSSTRMFSSLNLQMIGFKTHVASSAAPGPSLPGPGQ